MTVPYNISLTGVGEQLNEHFPIVKILNKPHFYFNEMYTIDNKDIYLTPKDYGEFTTLVYNVLTKKLPSLKNLTDYLNSLVNIVIALNKPIVWITPAGLKISLSPIQFESKVTQAKLIPNSKPVTISLPTTKYNTIKMRRSFMPNLIHSLDAANIHLLFRKVKNENININSIYTIHDCFATTANKMYELEQLIKYTFLDIYFTDGNYLEKMHNHIIDQIKAYSGNEILEENGEQYIQINKKIIKIPNIPTQFISNKYHQEFINGILNSIYFIK